MGFKNAWKLVSINSPLLGINQFFFFLQKVSLSYKGRRNQKNKNWGGLLLGDERASITLI